MNAITTLSTTRHPAISDEHDHEVLLLKAMAHPERYRVLKILAAEGEVQVNDLNRWIDLSQSALSQHLKVLRDAGFVTTRRDSQRIFYKLKTGMEAAYFNNLDAILKGI